MANTSRPSVDQLKRALSLTEQIQKLEAELAAILGSVSAVSVKRAYIRKAKGSKRRKPVISPEGKERIAAAQMARWAKLKKAQKQ